MTRFVVWVTPSAVASIGTVDADDVVEALSLATTMYGPSALVAHPADVPTKATVALYLDSRANLAGFEAEALFTGARGGGA